MNGIEGATGAERPVQAILGRGNSQPPADGGGALTSALQAVSRALASAGFVNITGQMRENLQVFLNRSPIDAISEDLKLDFLKQLASWVASKMIENPNVGEQAQAHVQPQAAVSLLT
jgi:hypothetical protein